MVEDAARHRREFKVQSSKFKVSEDDLFRWKKAMAKPTADAFAEFDFPEARMNEATCAIREGNWARAMKIYSALEWRIGQTPEIEQGMIAALALKHDNPAVELPVWRQVLRPVLRFGWKGRVGIVLGGFAALAALFWLLGRGIRAVACLAVVVGFASAANAQGLFEQMEEDKDGNEYGIIKNLTDFDGNGSDIIAEELKRKYFTPKIKRILSVKERFGYSYWETETEFGKASFSMHDTFRSIAKVSESRLILTDVDGNRYEIPDTMALDRKSYRKIELYL